jgi:hypothetical protein
VQSYSAELEYRVRQGGGVIFMQSAAAGGGGGGADADEEGWVCPQKMLTF